MECEGQIGNGDGTAARGSVEQPHDRNKNKKGNRGNPEGTPSENHTVHNAGARTYRWHSAGTVRSPAVPDDNKTMQTLKLPSLWSQLCY